MLAENRIHPLDGVPRQDIRITDIVTKLLSYRLTPEEQWADGGQHFVIWKTTTVVIEVHTDVGLVGIGGCSRYRGPELMRDYVTNVLKPFLLGKNPFDVEHLSGGMCGHGALGAWAGIDTALWDIIGQAAGVPCYALLATDCEPETHLRVYASGGEYSWQPNTRFHTPESLIDKAVAHQANGYTAMKFRPGAGWEQYGITMDRYIPIIRAMRQAVGPDFDLIQEANCRWTMEECLEIAPVLEELGFLWFEEPTDRRGEDAIARYRRIREALPTVMVSGGEGRPTRAELAPWVQDGGYDIVQQACDDAGMTEAWHMARMAALRDVYLCAHNWQGGLVTIANAHLMAACPNRLLLESNMTPNPLKEGLFNEEFKVVDGYIEVPDRPGLGVTLRDDLEARFPYIPGPWHLPDDAPELDA